MRLTILWDRLGKPESNFAVVFFVNSSISLLGAISPYLNASKKAPFDPLFYSRTGILNLCGGAISIMNIAAKEEEMRKKA